jgi:hypothetical protein
VDSFTVVVVLRAPRGLDGTAGGDLRMWQDEGEPTAWRTSIECAADDLEHALVLGRELADEIVDRNTHDAAVEEVVTMDDERQLVWRAEP